MRRSLDRPASWSAECNTNAVTGDSNRPASLILGTACVGPMRAVTGEGTDFQPCHAWSVLSDVSKGSEEGFERVRGVLNLPEYIGGKPDLDEPMLTVESPQQSMIADRLKMEPWSARDTLSQVDALLHSY